MKSNPTRRRAAVAVKYLPLCLVCALFSAACQSSRPTAIGQTAAHAGAAVQSLMPPKMSTTPDELIPGCHERIVRLRMGRPSEVQQWKTGDAVVGEVWYYEDYWWSKDRRGSQGFGSWAVYFDGRKRFVGWKLNSPVPQSPNAREVFYGVQPPMVDFGIQHGPGVTITGFADGSPAKMVRLNLIDPVDDSYDPYEFITPFGLETGDIIVELNGIPVREKAELFRVLHGVKSGPRYPITVERDGKKYHGEIPARDYFGITLSTGLTVKAVESGSPAAKVLRKGDTIIALDGVTIGHREEFYPILFGMKRTKSYPIVFERGGKTVHGQIPPS